MRTLLFHTDSYVEQCMTKLAKNKSRMDFEDGIQMNFVE